MLQLKHYIQIELQRTDLFIDDIEFDDVIALSWLVKTKDNGRQRTRNAFFHIPYELIFVSIKWILYGCGFDMCGKADRVEIPKINIFFINNFRHKNT